MDSITIIIIMIRIMIMIIALVRVVKANHNTRSWRKALEVEMNTTSVSGSSNSEGIPSAENSLMGE